MSDATTGWPGKCSAPEPGLGYPCARDPGHLEQGLPHATISGREWREPTPPPAPFAKAFAELRAIVAPEKQAEVKRWRDRWIDEAGAPSALSADAAGVVGLTERIRLRQAATFGDLLAARPGVLALTERPLEFGAVEFGAFLCVVRAEPKP